MTNKEKFIEIFGDAGYNVKASPEWLEKEYKGPVERSELEKFVDWLDTLPLIKYEVRKVSPANSAIYVYDYNHNAIIRVSDFNTEKDTAYVRYEGLTGDMQLTKIKEIIINAEKKSNPLDSIFGTDSLYNSIFGGKK